MSKKPHSQKRKPVDHRHPCVAAAIHVLKEVGGGPLSAIAIFQRAFDQGLLAASAYNTLRARLSQHQKVETVVVVKAGAAAYMLSESGIPADTPAAECAPSKLPVPAPLAADPLAIAPTPRPKRRRRRKAKRARDLAVNPEWLAERQAPLTVRKWVRLARWQAQWRDEDYPTAGDLLKGWAPREVTEWLIGALPLETDLKARLLAAPGHRARLDILWDVENPGKPSRSTSPSADTSATEASDVREPNGERTKA
jgi:hypothetical protein